MSYHAGWQGSLPQGCRESDHRVDSAGASLFVRQWLPAGEPTAVVQLVHGMCEHSERYRHVAGALAQRGWAVVAHDHRGHGYTAAGPGELGFFAEHGGWRRVLDDVYAVAEHARGLCPGGPHALVGHSMGSFLAQQYAIERGAELGALVLSGTDARSDAGPRAGSWLAAAIAALRGPRHRSTLVDRLTTGSFARRFPDRRSEAEWVSRDSAVVEAYDRDPLCGFTPTVTMWRDILQGVYFIGRPENRRRVPAGLPVQLLAGGEDPLSDGGKRVHGLADAYRSGGLGDVSVNIYPGARHEVFNETNRQTVCLDMARWLEERLGPAVPSEAAH